MTYHLPFSKRAGGAHLPNKLAQSLDRKRKSGVPVTDFTESNPTRCGFKFSNSNVLRALLDDKNLLYEPDPRGLLEAREAVAAYYAE